MRYVVLDVPGDGLPATSGSGVLAPGSTRSRTCRAASWSAASGVVNRGATWSPQEHCADPRSPAAVLLDALAVADALSENERARLPENGEVPTDQLDRLAELTKMKAYISKIVFDSRVAAAQVDAIERHFEYEGKLLAAALRVVVEQLVDLVTDDVSRRDELRAWAYAAAQASILDQPVPPVPLSASPRVIEAAPSERAGG